MPTSHQFRHVLGAAVFVWLALASVAFAQSMLGGVVNHPSGQVAANVTVVAENEETRETRETRSSSLGIYAFYHLRTAPIRSASTYRR